MNMSIEHPNGHVQWTCPFNGHVQHGHFNMSIHLLGLLSALFTYYGQSVKHAIEEYSADMSAKALIFLVSSLTKDFAIRPLPEASQQRY